MAEHPGPMYSSSGEDRLPWLEPVDDSAVDYSVPRSRLVGAIVAALAVIAVVVGGLFWVQQRATRPAGGEVALIPAPAGDYKAKPDNPGGLKVEGQGDATYAASQGADPNARIDLNALPETPVKTAAATPPAPPATKPTPAPAVPAAPAVKVASAAPAKPAKPAPAKPAPKIPEVPVKTAASSVTPTPAAKPMPAKRTAATVTAEIKPAAGGAAIQLGAFSSQAKADAAWTAMSGRFAALGALSKDVVAADKGGAKVYRLRAVGSGAPGVCGKLKVAGESCVVIRD